MSKSKKRRNKPYTGNDAAHTRPVIHRYTAVKRAPIQEWWLEKKRGIKIGASIFAVIAFVFWILFEAIRVIF